MPDVIYQVALGWDNTAGYARMVLQPATPEGIKWPELIFAGDGSAAYNGFAQTDLLFAGGYEDAERNALMAQFGLTDSLASGPTASAKVTVRLPDNDGSAIDVNAWAILPERKRRRWGFYEDFTISLNIVEVVV